MSDFFEVSSNGKGKNSRGHKKKIVKQRATTRTGEHSFSYRVVNSWNNLTGTAVEAESLLTFKKELSKNKDSNGRW